MLDRYHNRFDPAKQDEAVLFRDGYVIQGAELNELQSIAQHRLKGIADVLFKDGDLIRDAQIAVDARTGQVRCEAGAVYLKGAVRGVPPATLTIPLVGPATVGVYLVDTVVSELDDPSLRNPATGDTFDEPGAGRLRSVTRWGTPGDGQGGEFFAVYSLHDGVQQSKEPPPQLDAFTQAIARYDRDSTGGSYLVRGLDVVRLAEPSDSPPDSAMHRLTLSVAAGRAYVQGHAVELATARRLVDTPTPDLLAIDAEPHVSLGPAPQRLTVQRTPLDPNSPIEVRITAEKTVTLTHGSYTGAQDPLPDAAVLELVAVTQGGTDYAIGTVVKLSAGKVDWSLPGAEPAPGSSYQVTYRHITNGTPSAIDAEGLTVSGAVAGSLVLVSYRQMLPRIDLLCLAGSGELRLLRGVAAAWSPQPPVAPADLLPLAQIHHRWQGSPTIPTIKGIGVRMLPMATLAHLESRIDRALYFVAQQRLESNIHLIEAGAKKGLFVDPFLDDSQRDAGAAQTAAIVGGVLTLPITASAFNLPADIVAPSGCAFTPQPALEQTARTGQMAINPYMAFAPQPARVSLTPAVDRWTEVQSSWSSPLTQRFVFGAGDMSSTSVSSSNVLLGSTTQAIETLRPIEVRFEIAGFGPNERLLNLAFDGLALEPTP